MLVTLGSQKVNNKKKLSSIDCRVSWRRFGSMHFYGYKMYNEHLRSFWQEI